MRNDQEIVTRYLDGETATEVARSMRIGTSTVYRVLDRAGIERRTSGRRALSPQAEAQLLDGYRDGVAMRRLASTFGVDVGTVRNLVARAGLPRRPIGGARVDPELDSVVLALHREGLSQTETGRRLGISQDRVSRILRRHGIRVERRSGEKHWRWAGGRARSGGYVLVRLTPDHPMWSMANGGGYVLEHRLVMAESLGRPLTRSETVHHINDDKTDNRLENLQLRQGQHGNGVAMRCVDCGSHNVEAVTIA